MDNATKNILSYNVYKDFSPMPLDLQGWNGEGQVFEDLVKWTKPELIIEVGTWKGQSSFSMMDTAKKIGLDTKMYCVDTWLGGVEMWHGNMPQTWNGSTYEKEKWTDERDLRLKNGYPSIYYQFISNVIHKGYTDRIIPFPQTSTIAWKWFYMKEIKADLIYIDASHEYNDVVQDLNLYWKILKPGGYMFGDDYNSWAGVEHGVNDFVKQNNLKLDVFSLKKGWNEKFEQTWWVLKK